MGPRHVGPRRFLLVRERDPSGVSGTGIVAEGVLFSDHKAALSWRTGYRSVAIYERMGDLEAVHGHGGATRVVWLDGPEEDEGPAGDEGPQQGAGPAMMAEASPRHERRSR